MSETTAVGSVPYRELTLAVIGTGAWGVNHVRVLTELGVQVTVFDADPVRTAAMASQFPQVRTTSSLGDVLDDSSITGVVVATPARTHAYIASECLRAEKDVLVEKPMALSLEDAERLQDQADGSGQILAVGHVLEYHPAVVRMCGLVAEGFVGRVKYLYANRLNFGRIRTEENVLWSFAPHDIAIMLRLLGARPLEVACHGSAHVSPGIDDTTLTSLVFDREVRGHIFVSWLHPFKEHRFVIVGERRTLVFDDTASWSEKLTAFEHSVDWIDGQVPIARKAPSEAIAVQEEEPLRVQAKAFLDSIVSRKPPLADGQSGLDVLRVLMAAQQSRESAGRTIGQHSDQKFFVHPTATVDQGSHIGARTKVWHYTHVMPGAEIGEDCTLGQNVFVGSDARVGRGCKVQNNVSIYDGVRLEDGVFCGPSVVFTNVIDPRAEVDRRDEIRETIVRRGATIGANATIVCGVEIGSYSFLAAGAVVTRDVPSHALVMGAPARVVGWVCRCGRRLAESSTACESCGRMYERSETGIRVLD